MDETQPLVTEAPTSAPVTAPEATAAPEIAANEQPADQQQRTFSQDEVDALITKRLAKEQRKWERKLQQPAPAAPSVPKEVPPADQFESVEAYAQALAEKRAAELVQQRESQQQQAQVLESHRDREESAREKYDDYEDVVYNPKLAITPIMAQTIQASDMGPDVAYYLGTNPKEAERIARMPAIAQAKEIGKLEAKLTSNPPVKKTTTAPTPISPVSARTTSTSLDTTDPRAAKQMSASEWIAAERARQARQWEARNR
jgi:hypothetical protein